MVRRFLLGLILLGITTVTYGQEDAKEAKVTWDDQVSAVFRQRCVTCHNVNKKSGGLDISTYTNLMLGGSSGDVLEPGDASSSYLFLLITHESEPFMPPNSDPIPANEISLVEKWINQGMPENAGSKVMVAKKPKFEMTLDPNATGKPETPPMPGRLNKAPNIYSPKRAAVTAIATNPWSSLTAVAGQKKISLYDVATMELLGVLDFPEGIAHVLKFSRNGSLLLAGGGIGAQSGKVVVYNVKNGERIFEVGDEFDVVLGADISADQSMIALGGPLKMIRVYSTATGDLMYETKKHTDWITKMEFSPDGVLLATGDRNGGMHGIIQLLIKKANTPKKAQISIWFFGLIIFFDDYSNTLIVGNTSRLLCDKLGISREKLAYLVDSTSAPVATIAVITTWIGFQISIISLLLKMPQKL